MNEAFIIKILKVKNTKSQNLIIVYKTMSTVFLIEGSE